MTEKQIENLQVGDRFINDARSNESSVSTVMTFYEVLPDKQLKQCGYNFMHPSLCKDAEGKIKFQVVPMVGTVPDRGINATLRSERTKLVKDIDPTDDLVSYYGKIVWG